MIKILTSLLVFPFLLACSSSKKDREMPEPNRFTYEVLADGLDEPLQLEFDDHGQVYWIERTGAIKKLDEASGEILTLGKVSLAEEKAPGLIGILLDRNFEENRQLFLYYSAREDRGQAMRLSRFLLDGKGLVDLGSEKVLIRIPWEQPDGEHFGGGMTWDASGNLYLSVGGDSAPTQYAPLPFANTGGRGQDSGRTAGNTNDYRGAILRIWPRPEGGYVNPKGNLYPEGTPGTLPEIYIMGNRNPWRLSIDSQTGFLHWGEVGPDAGVDSEKYGPMGYDEFNVAKKAGNFGWPFFIGDNLAYNHYDYATGNYGAPYDPENPFNDSPNNDGLEKLPPAQPSLVAYPYRVSPDWPVLGSAARSAVGGPVFRKKNFSPDAPGLFPEYYEGKWLVTDYVRNWIMVISMDPDRTEVLDIEPLLPAGQSQHSQPLDMDFGPSGDLYLVEYGRGNQGKIGKISYNKGNRAPIAKATVSTLYGRLPLTVNFFADQSLDPDGDELEYQWEISGPNNFEGDNVTETFTFDQPGKYQVTLQVTDSQGAADSANLEILAGNEQPEVNINVLEGNQTFYFPEDSIRYQVLVEDEEDGSLEGGEITLEEFSFTAEYMPSGLSPGRLAALKEEGALEPGMPFQYVQARSQLQENNCMSCHRVEEKLLGPAFFEIAEKYVGDSTAYDTLRKSIKEGSQGKWGESIMPPHSSLSDDAIKTISDYIFSFVGDEQALLNLPAEGVFKLQSMAPSGPAGRLGKFYRFDREPGAYLFHAHYKDRGVAVAEGLNLSGDAFLLLRYPLFPPETADYFSDEGISFTPSTDDPGFIITGEGGYIGFRDIDLTGVSTVKIGAVTRFWHWSHFTGATIELLLGSPDGERVGEKIVIQPEPVKEGDGPFFGEDAGLPIPIDVSAVSGQHDLYIKVYREGADENEALVILTGIGFEK